MLRFLRMSVTRARAIFARVSSPIRALAHLLLDQATQGFDGQVWRLGRLELAQGFLIELGEVELPDTGLGVQVGDLLGLDDGSRQLGQVQVDVGGHRLTAGLTVRGVQLHHPDP